MPGDDGKPELIFKYLNKHAAEVKSGKFSSPNPKDVSKTITVELVTSSAQRGGAMRDFRPQSSDLPGTDFSNMLDGLAEMATKIAEIQAARLIPPDAEYRYLRHMGHCLDLRKMAFEADYGSSNQAAMSLKVLYEWMAQRDRGGGAGASAGAAADADSVGDLPEFDEVRAQWAMLISRLRMFHTDSKYSHWKGASGTVIMKDVFTDVRLYDRIDAFLYLFQHMALKSMCEAVIEGMGGMWDRCASDNRHPGFETGAEEAVVAWNAPQPYHPAADAFVTNALNDVFGFDKQGHPKPWNLTHRDAAADHHIGRALGRSVVISRHKRNDQPRFPSQYYDISTQP